MAEKETRRRERKVVASVWKVTKVHRENFKKRREEIQTRRLKLLQQKAQEISKRERDLKEEELTLKIQKYGLWTTKAEVELKLSELRTKKAKASALKPHVSFRKKRLFQFSHSHKQLSVQELSDNLCKLLLPSMPEADCLGH